ncbi:hypothetical protein K474DRAFT_1676518 [Panus rudis PR-1116 ss-1]|nr:hypothetical protein K474DRAFT_1676518 [Panus rudis PR-1116 ss-1]
MRLSFLLASTLAVAAASVSGLPFSESTVNVADIRPLPEPPALAARDTYEYISRRDASDGDEANHIYSSAGESLIRRAGGDSGRSSQSSSRRPHRRPTAQAYADPRYQSGSRLQLPPQVHQVNPNFAQTAPGQQYLQAQANGLQVPPPLDAYKSYYPKQSNKPPASQAHTDSRYQNAPGATLQPPPQGHQLNPTFVDSARGQDYLRAKANGLQAPPPIDAYKTYNPLAYSVVSGQSSRAQAGNLRPQAGSSARYSGQQSSAPTRW